MAEKPPPADDFIYLGTRMLLLSVLCTPVVFIPLAVYCGMKANTMSLGAGDKILYAAGILTLIVIAAIFCVRKFV